MPKEIPLSRYNGHTEPQAREMASQVGCGFYIRCGDKLPAVRFTGRTGCVVAVLKEGKVESAVVVTPD